MPLSFIRNRRLVGMISASGLISFIILNRWLVTDKGQNSFGRIWQYYVSWFDFGFHRRGLLGTVLTETGINQIVSNEYLFTYLFYGLLLVISYVLVGSAMARHEKLRNNNWLQFCVLFSPAIFSHFAYSTGNLDLLLFILLFTAVFYARSTSILAFVLVAGVLTHELFILMLPAIFILKVLANSGEKLELSPSLVVPAAAALAAILAVTLLGTINVDVDTFEVIMAKRMPLAAHQRPLWSGYFEISSAVAQNQGQNITDLLANKWYLFLPTAYAFLVAAVFILYLEAGMVSRLLVFLAVLLPLLTNFVAEDYFRWTSISAYLSFTGIMIFVANGKLKIPTWYFILLAAFFALAPFGSADLSRPFPMHQFILELVARHM